MDKRESYPSRANLGRRVLLLLLSIALVLTMMPMLPGYVGEANAATNQVIAGKAMDAKSNPAVANENLPTEYTISFEANGGLGTMPALPCTGNGSVVIPPNAFTKTGYTFKEWNIKEDGDGNAYADGAIAPELNSFAGGPSILYAQWKPNSYKVRFNSNGGNGIMTDLTMVYDAEKDLTANTFVRTGYTFGGWNTKADGNGTPIVDTQSVNNLTTTNNGTVYLFAQWIPNTYKVKFDANGGLGSMADQSMTYDKAANLTENSNNIIKIGSTFGGWNTKADGSGTAYTDKQSVKNLAGQEKNNDTITLYAQWKQIDITIDDIPAQTYTGQAIEPPLTVKSGDILLTPTVHYDVIYSDNTQPGTAKVTVTLKGDYSGSKTAEFTIKNTFKAKGQWVSSHEDTYATFNWTGTPNNKLATAWDVQYRTKLIGTKNPWGSWISSHESGTTLSKRLYLKPNYTIEFKVKHETDATYLRSVFTTPAGGKYQSITQCRVKVVAGGTATNIKVGTNYSGDSGNVLIIKRGQTVKITPNHVYPRSNFQLYPRLYPNHAWYDVADGTKVSLTGMNSTAGMKDSAVTIEGLNTGTTTIKITSCNGRGATLTIVVR